VTTYPIWLCQIGIFEVIEMCRSVSLEGFRVGNTGDCSYAEP